MSAKFTHLHTHSHFSLLYGPIEFYKKAKAAGIKPILGVEAYIAPNSRHDKNPQNEKYYHLILLCENEIGWRNLIKLVTKSNLEGFYYKPRMDKELLRQHHEGIIPLSGCYSGELIQSIINNNPPADRPEKIINEYKEIFGQNNYFIEIGHHPNFDQPKKKKKHTPLTH